MVSYGLPQQQRFIYDDLLCGDDSDWGDVVFFVVLLGELMGRRLNFFPYLEGFPLRSSIQEMFQVG